VAPSVTYRWTDQVQTDLRYEVSRSLADAAGLPDRNAREALSLLTAAAEALDAAIGNDAAPVVVAAAPSALRVLRRAYSPRVRKALAVELDRDFTHLSVEDIAVRLASI